MTAPPCRHMPRLATRIAAVAIALSAGAGAAWATAAAAAAQQSPPAEIEILPVRNRVYMLVGSGGNTTIHVGDDGVMVVDTQFAQDSERLLRAIRSLSDKPIRYVVNTHVHGDHIGGNVPLAKAGRTRAGGNVIGDIGAAATDTARILAHENVLHRMVKATGANAVPDAAWPTETFFGGRKDMLFNGEAVQFVHAPAAHTDGDVMVFFRRSDVIATGDLFTTVMYPVIDRANGGTINGYIDALNAIIDITVPSNVNEGGTLVIPGHGRLCDEQDVIEYRDMTTIIRDRIREYVKRGMSLDQVKAARPTLDFDPRYGSTTGGWTTDMFIGAIYDDMRQEAAAAGGGGGVGSGRPGAAR